MSIITYRTDICPDAGLIIELYKSAGLTRPVDDKARIAKMYAHSNLIVTAWQDMLLVGVSRALTDFSYCCYLSDLAVRAEFQHIGIGRKLVELTREKIGEESMLLLLSASTAMNYYPHIGMEPVHNGFMIKRKY